MKQIILILVLFYTAIQAFGQTKPQSEELAFIGKKISVEKKFDGYTYVTRDNYSSGMITSVPDIYVVKYCVKKILSGYYPDDTITFITRSSYYKPALMDSVDFLLCLTYLDSGYVGNSAAIVDVFETKDNRWACDYSFDKRNVKLRRETDPLPEKIEFKEKVSFNIHDLFQFEIDKKYPSPYYNIVGDRAFAVYGYYAVDVMKMISGRVQITKKGKQTFMFLD